MLTSINKPADPSHACGRAVRLPSRLPVRADLEGGSGADRAGRLTAALQWTQRCRNRGHAAQVCSAPRWMVTVGVATPCPARSRRTASEGLAPGRRCRRRGRRPGDSRPTPRDPAATTSTADRSPRRSGVGRGSDGARPLHHFGLARPCAILERARRPPASMASSGNPGRLSRGRTKWGLKPLLATRTRTPGLG